MNQQVLFQSEITPAEASARELIRCYVKRGDDPVYLRGTQCGCWCPDGMGASIGGYIDGKRYDTTFIVVERDINGKLVNQAFRFQDIYDAILEE